MFLELSYFFIIFVNLREVLWIIDLPPQPQLLPPLHFCKFLTKIFGVICCKNWAHLYIKKKKKKREWSNAICSNMDATRDFHTKWSKKKTNTIWYHLYAEITIWHKWTSLWNRLTGIANRPMVAKGEWSGRGRDWEFGVSRCKLLQIEWINNKVVLYGTGNYIQYPRINHNWKEYKKEWILNVYNWVTLLYHRN